MGRILALDYGRARVGCAVSDPLGFTAQPLDVWIGLNRENLIRRIVDTVGRLSIETVVIGFPMTLKNEKGPLAIEVEHLANAMRSVLSIPVVLWDERLTTVQAIRTMHAMKQKPSRHKEKIDRMASVLLLQNFLEFRSDHDTSVQGGNR